MTSPLTWSGVAGIAANNGIKPKLYSPRPYEEGSSITHLDENTFSSGSPNAVMTPVLDPGEIFRSPGPVALAMLDDMLQKPPANRAQTLPTKPINAKALVGDKYALVTFDSPTCRRIDRITGYNVTVDQTGDKPTPQVQPASPASRTASRIHSPSPLRTSMVNLKQSPPTPSSPKLASPPPPSTRVPMQNS
jgi:hypothetical protein